MINKALCIERDAGRCRICGTTENVDAYKLVERNGEIASHLSNLITLCEKCEEDRFSIPDSNRLGVLLCGGRGTRLFPITRTINKHVLPIGVVPMSSYPIRTLRKLGVKKVVIVVDQFASEIMDTLGSGKAYGMDFCYKIQDGAFGIADALYLAKDEIDDCNEIVCVLGDNIFDNDNLDSEISLGDDKACIFVKEVNNPEDYGVAVIENGKVQSIIEKPQDYISNMAVLGLYMYTTDVFDVIENIEPSDRGELEISSVNDYYAACEMLKYHTIKGYWADCGGSIQKYCAASLHGAKEANVSKEEINNFVSMVFDEK